MPDGPVVRFLNLAVTFRGIPVETVHGLLRKPLLEPMVQGEAQQGLIPFPRSRTALRPPPSPQNRSGSGSVAMT